MSVRIEGQPDGSVAAAYADLDKSRYQVVRVVERPGLLGRLPGLKKQTIVVSPGGLSLAAATEIADTHSKRFGHDLFLRRS